MSHTQLKTDTTTVCGVPEKLLSLLIKSSVLTTELAESLCERSKNDPKIFEKLLTQEGYLTEEQFAQMKGQAYGWHFVDLDSVAVDEEMLKTFPRAFLMTQRVVPYILQGKVGIAMADLGDAQLRRLLSKKIGLDVRMSLATASDIASALSRHDEGYAATTQGYVDSFDAATKRNNTDDLSAVHIVSSILTHAIRRRSSDIHIEPRKEQTFIRERTDGVLKTQLKLPKSMHDLIATRIKVVSNLATDEHSRPQDGKMQFETPEGSRIDIRVSVSPTINGEKIVMRLLAPQSQSLPLEQLGLHGDDLTVVKEQMERAWGMILVTGPTGSGKTTTLYAGIRLVHKDDVNIETIEDPVEYDLPGVNQMQVNEKAGVTFANGLRALVRQDPDVVLVGEIRDKDTASIAVNAAMTGHLVLSTLHTNDAATSFPRLMDMNVEPFLIASTVNVVVAQRLVRTLCVRCRESIDVPVAELKGSLSAEAIERIAGKSKTVRLYHGKGCSVCNNTGFHGRTGIFEVMKVSKNIQDLIMQRATAETIKQAAVEEGMRTMFEDGIEKVLEGVTTIEEIIRVTRT